MNELMKAAASGDIDQMQKCIDNRPFVAGQNESWSGWIVSSLTRERISIKDYVNQQGRMGETALMYCKNRAAAQFLIDNGADINLLDYSGGHALIWAAAREDTGVVMFLIAYGAKVDLQDNRGETALMSAITNDRIPVAKFLIEQGAEVNQKNNKGRTALMLCENQEVAKFLIENGAKVDLQDNYGGTALMSAITNDRIPVAKFLIEQGAEVNQKDDWWGYTALMHAIDNGKLDAVSFLLTEGRASIAVQDINGKTALMKAEEKKWSTSRIIQNGSIVTKGNGVKILNLVKAAEEADKFLAGIMVEKILPSQVEVFTSRIAYHLIDQPNAEQYDRLMQYCAKSNLSLPSQELQTLLDLKHPKDKTKFAISIDDVDTSAWDDDIQLGEADSTPVELSGLDANAQEGAA